MISPFFATSKTPENPNGVICARYLSIFFPSSPLTASFFIKFFPDSSLLIAAEVFEKKKKNISM